MLCSGRIELVSGSTIRSAASPDELGYRAERQLFAIAIRLPGVRSTPSLTDVWFRRPGERGDWNFYPAADRSAAPGPLSISDFQTQIIARANLRVVHEQNDAAHEWRVAKS